MILVSTASRADADAAMRGCSAACQTLDAEVIVVRAAEPGRMPLGVISELGWQLLEVPAGCSSAQMRAEGMAAASGDIVAFRTDADAGDGIWLDAYCPLLDSARVSTELERAVPVIDERKVAEAGRRGTPLRDEAVTRRFRAAPGAAEVPVTRGS